ncbi:MAG: DUF423 domain-containing protein [Pusillimonas sp.]
MNDRHLVVIAALTLMVGVGAGAFGAHGLKAILSADMLAIWQTAVLYQMIHGLGILGIAALLAHRPDNRMVVAGLLMFAGIVIFSGSLYILTLTGVRGLGAITPVGGAAFIAGWALLAWAAWRTR